jgi:hypothetical protein
MGAGLWKHSGSINIGWGTKPIQYQDHAYHGDESGEALWIHRLGSWKPIRIMRIAGIMGLVGLSVGSTLSPKAGEEQLLGSWRSWKI